MEYDRDLNACVNIAHALMSSIEWGSSALSELADEVGGVKPQLKVGSSRLQLWSSSHIYFRMRFSS